MFIKKLSILITDRCNASCGICCFGCSPHNSALLDKDTVKQYIFQASEIGIENVNFSGGEPLLYYEYVKECMEYAYSLGLKSTLISNGFWAENSESGLKMIQQLKSAGLSHVALSTDQFHAQFVPTPIIIKAVEICEKLGINVYISITDTKDGTGRNTAEELRHIIPYIKLKIFPVYPVGGALKTLPKTSYIKEKTPLEALCPFDKEIVLYFDGMISMCCSQFNREIPLLTLGKFGQTSLATAVDAFNSNDFLYVLLKRGFKWYVELAQSLDININQKYGSNCELCHHLFSNPQSVEQFSPFVSEEAVKIRIEKLLQSDN